MRPVASVIFIFVFSNIGAAFKADVSSWVSLTYPLSEKTPVYPGVYDPLRINPEKSAATDEWPGVPAADGTYVAFRFIEMYEHTGTHVDAPSHFCKGCKDEAELTWEELTGPLVIINVREIVKNANTTSFHLRAEHLEPFVEHYGPIESGSFLFINTGWGDHYWSDGEKYAKEPACLGESAVDWVLEHAPDILGLGIDGLSPECGDNKSFRLHTTMLPRGQLIVENVKSSGMDQLPPKGSYLMMFPMHLKGGTGSPARLIAVNSGAKLEKFHLIFGVILASMFIVF
ncbi:kynurenine formamidase-like [Symsagittifera roscoffensis]|uniref:kynurenine formamidase-like n=1 Tax=Symsagittifera roscoffensis TaxID=84072 RepID=UPI00307BF087